MTEPTFDEWITQHLHAWWNGLSTTNREVLTAAAKADDMADAIVALLIETRCPIGPIATKWEHEDAYSWSWNGRVQNYITDQSTLGSIQ